MLFPLIPPKAQVTKINCVLDALNPVVTTQVEYAKIVNNFD